MTFEQYWQRREKEIKYIYTKFNLKWLKKEAKFSWHEALTNTVPTNSNAILTSAMHSDGDKQCLCPAGIGICGFGNPDTKICNHPRR